MALDAAQRATLAAHIRANTDPNVVAALAGRNDTELARLYNLPSTFIVWRESVEPDEYREALVWTEIDGLQTGKARIWEWVTQNMTMPLNATSANVRQGIADAFPANQSTRGQLLEIAKEACSIFEEIYATGTGTDVDPGTRVIAGLATINDISSALNENP